METNDIRNLVRQIDALGEYSNSLLGDMAIDRGGPEDVAYRTLRECFHDPVERHAELVRSLNDGSPLSRSTLRRLSADYPSRSRYFMGMREMVNRRIQNLTDDIAAHPENAALHIVNLERSVLTMSGLLDEVTAAQAPLDRATSTPSTVSPPIAEPTLCSICFETVSVNLSTACNGCHKRVHTACLNGYRNSAGPNVPCPTCRTPFS
jgi:hypothetical protein